MLKRSILTWLAVLVLIGAASARPAAACTVCNNCSTDDFTLHSNTVSSGVKVFGTTHGCTASITTCPHSLCQFYVSDGVSAPFEPESALAELSGGPRALLSFVGRYVPWIRLNVERSAIQLASPCDSTVIVFHYPVEPMMFGTVALALQQTPTPTLSGDFAHLSAALGVRNVSQAQFLGVVASLSSPNGSGAERAGALSPLQRISLVRIDTGALKANELVPST